MKDFNWKDLLFVLAAVLIGGAGWTVDSQAVVITAVSILAVWLVQWSAKTFGWTWHPGKMGLTLLLFVLAVGLSILFMPVAPPAFPAIGEDFAVWLPLFIAYLGAWVALAGPVVANATLIYNILLANVLEKLSSELTVLVLPNKADD